MDMKQEALNEFFAEVEETLESVDEILITIEKKGKDRESIDALYRHMHSMKGNAFLFGLQNFGQIAHALESSPP